MNFPKITKETFDHITSSRKPKEFVQFMESIELQEGIFIPKDEWKQKSNPITVIHTLPRLFQRRGLERKFTGKTTPQGWYILRIK